MDTYLLFKLNSFAASGPILRWVTVFFAEYLLYIILVALSIAIIFSLRRWSRGKNPATFIQLARILVSALIARFAVAEAIRFFYDRPRPFAVLEQVNQLIPHSVNHAFPSGNASFMFALSAAAFFYSRPWGIILFAAALLTGIARIAAGVHWPSDILAGALVGIGTAWLLQFFKNKSR